MPASDYFESLLLGYALLQSPFSIEDWYVGLWLTDPTADGLLGGEVTAADYQRKPVSWNPAFTNISEIAWAAATSNWGTVNYTVLVNSAQKGTGKVLAWGTVSPAIAVTTGKPVTIPASSLPVTIT